MLMLALPFMTSCSKDEQQLDLAVSYDLTLPKPMLEVADAYVTYVDNGVTKTEQVVNGRFQKSFTYTWEDDQVKTSEMSVNALKLTYKLKVPQNQLREGTQLLKDNNASYKVSYSYQYGRTKENNWTGNSSATSGKGGDNLTYVHSDEQKKYKYTVAEQLSLFNGQESKPFMEASFDHLNTSFTYHISFNLGQDDDKLEVRRF